MKNSVANEVRANYISIIMSLFAEKGEDVGMIASNSFNFPIVVDGEESWLEVVVKIPKEDEGYAKREEYVLKCDERKAKAEEKAKAKAKAEPERYTVWQATVRKPRRKPKKRRSNPPFFN